MNTPLWQPSDEALKHSHMAEFIKKVNTSFNLTISNYANLHQWSVEHSDLFWNTLWDYCDVRATKRTNSILKNPENIEKACWFEEAELNFAENLLRRRDRHPAIFFIDERGSQQTLSYETLYSSVGIMAYQLRQWGIKAGDRVAAFMPNSPETIIAMLASASIGAIWSSCSPDFGLQGLLDRFSQIKPTLLFATTTHQYQGKTHYHMNKIIALQKQLTQLKKTILLTTSNDHDMPDSLEQTHHWDDVMQGPSVEPIFTPLPFNHPLYILYSSGTTGRPKCMVHGAGGTLLQHLKELVLHTDLNPQDRHFFYTTCGWMMWNWLVSSLAVGATIVLYEGAPFYPSSSRLLDLIDKLDITVFGLGAKLIEHYDKSKLLPKKTHSFKSLKTLLTTGSPLLPHSFDYVYQKIKKDVRLSSISGGSDIISCFMLGNPILPVYRGELQCAGLGMDVAVFNSDGKAVLEQKGELVCRHPFPAMPLYFWNDPDGKRYHDTYFKRFPGVWTHGDYVEKTTHQGFIIYGRSDATLNPGGVRIGTAEIYQQVEKIHEVQDCMAIGQAWESSERIILFVVLKNEFTLSSKLIKKIKAQIRNNTSPHHVPAKIIAAPELPRTRNGKLVEIAVKQIIHNQPVENTEALSNPECLSYFYNLTT